MNKLFLMAFLTLGCAAPQERAREVVGSLIYVKDTRTGYCFATYMGPRRRDSVVFVPCQGISSKDINYYEE